MSVQSARENAVLDVLVRRATTVSEVMSALDGHGMPASPRGVGDTLAALIRRGLVRRAGSFYALTVSGRDEVRRRKSLASRA
jgi:DNA-binding PadR family transcriptional regulator